MVLALDKSNTVSVQYVDRVVALAKENGIAAQCGVTSTIFPNASRSQLFASTAKIHLSELHPSWDSAGAMISPTIAPLPARKS